MDKVDVMISYLRELRSIVSNHDISENVRMATEERIIKTCALIDAELAN
jgi:hypothetical protein